jgi:hypothetical protein
MSTTKADWLLVLYPIPPEERIRGCNELNRWGWPACIPENLKPLGWDGMTTDEKHKSAELRDLMWAFYETCSVWELSWAHWRDNLNRTPKDHADWWMSDDSALAKFRI